MKMHSGRAAGRLTAKGVLAAATLGLVLGSVMGATTPSLAHQPNDYPYPWTYTILNRRFYVGIPQVWPGGPWNARTQDAMQEWNSVPGASLTFSLEGDALQGEQPCGPRDLIQYDDIDGQGGKIGMAILCSPVNSTAAVVLDSDDYPWHPYVGTPNPTSEWDLQGLITHELGHATRGWAECVAPDEDKNKDPCEGMHYDTTNNGLLCSAALTYNHTMCSAVSKTNSWRHRSIEEHDIDIFQNAY